MQTSLHVGEPFPWGSGSIQVLYDLGFSLPSMPRLPGAVAFSWHGGGVWFSPSLG